MHHWIANGKLSGLQIEIFAYDLHFNSSDCSCLKYTGQMGMHTPENQKYQSPSVPVKYNIMLCITRVSNLQKFLGTKGCFSHKR